MHGIILCGGQGSRFAKSVGKPYPYPKHLERVGDKTVLELALSSMQQLFGVTDVTCHLNPALSASYIPHLIELQQKYPEIEISYKLNSGQGEGDPGDCMRDLWAGSIVHVRDGREDIFDADTVTMAPGDQFLSPETTDFQTVKNRVQSIVDGLPERGARDIAAYHEGHGFIYLVGAVNDITSYMWNIEIVNELHIMNINASEDLEHAKGLIANAEGAPHSSRERMF